MMFHVKCRFFFSVPFIHETFLLCLERRGFCIYRRKVLIYIDMDMLCTYSGKNQPLKIFMCSGRRNVLN